jgi:hypothetical protein
MEYPQMVIRIHPKLEATARCVKCQSTSVDICDYLFEGIHVLAECWCNACSTGFYHTLPTGHDAQTPIAFSRDGSISRFDKSAEVWLARPLIDAMVKKPEYNPEITRKNLKPLKENIVLLNCLDNCFGHSYAKLLNALQLMKAHPGHSLVLLITQNFEWLVPKGVDELWIVSASMHDMRKHVANLQGFVKQQLTAVKQCDLSVAKVYHDLAAIDSEPFLKTKSFDIAKFDELPRTVTFVLRADRYWLANRLDDFINRVFIKLKIQKSFRAYFIRKQNRLVKKTIDKLKDVHVNVVRTDTKSITPEIEKQWCDLYAKSHLVIGVHGSNMLIPTSLAAGFIEILPSYKIPHLGEDVVLRHDGRDAILLGRHVEQYCSPSLLARHITEALKFSQIRRLITS